MKHLFKNTLGIFILLLASTCQIFSQEIIVSKMPPPDGNTSGVKGIAQDINGFMWFATGTGLYGYNGYQITIYKHNPEDPNSLSSDSVFSLAIDLNGKIWLGTSKGLNQFDPATGLFKHYSHDPEKPGSISSRWVNSLLVDHEGTLWIGTDVGLNQYDRETDSFKFYGNIPGDSTSLSYNHVWTIYEDKMGNIWVGTAEIWNKGYDYLYSGGLNKFNKKEGTFTRYLHDPNNPKSLINNKVTAIFEDSQGTFWVGTAGDGLHTMDREKGLFTRHTYDPKHPEKLSRPPFIEKGNPYEHITFINEDAAGAIWIGTYQYGLVYYDPKTKKTKSGKDFKGDQIDWMPKVMFSSKEGVIWIGTEIGNIYQINPIQNKIPQFTSLGSIKSFYEEPDGTLWMLNDKELIRTKTNGIINRIVIDENPSTSVFNTLKIISGDRQGNI